MNKYPKNFLKLFFFVFLVLSGLVLISNKIQGQGKAQSHIPVCPGPAGKSTARCHARVIVDSQGKPQTSINPKGYGPAQFHGAYLLPATASGTPIIAIVDAYDDPNIAFDLNTYSVQYGLPTLPNCVGSISSSSVPCFKKIDQNGGTNYPQANASWALEISLDVEIAHAVCPNCRILLVEANSNSYSNLMAAVDQAVSQGAKIISNSYGSNEFSSETSFDSHFNHTGTVITFSSGDGGYGVEYPAASPYVVAVGGTTLNLSGTTYVSESAWNGSGSGCSAYETLKPVGQPPIAGCQNRIVADVSADADPNTGAAIYDSVRFQGKKGWFQVGGTSLSSPLIAATYALSSAIPSGVQANTIPYGSVNYGTNLHDVVTGSTINCDGTSLCTAGPNYDGATGLGTPNGTGAF